MLVDNRKTIKVYLDTGNVYSYEVNGEDRAREHASEIIKSGYRHTETGTNDLEWFPPHRISKIKVDGGAESTKYKDKVSST